MKKDSHNTQGQYHPRLQDLLQRYPVLSACTDDIEHAINQLINTFKNQYKVLICGNGGSASDADHIAGELMKGFFNKRPLDSHWAQLLGPDISSKLQHGLPVIPLPNLIGINTAYANDCDPAYIFAQTTFALGQAGDVLLCLSTSGNSKNILLAAQVARAKQMPVIALTGHSGGQLKALSDICICAPAERVDHIQELHLPIYHTLCLGVEDSLFGSH